jgi:hypothetical protein
MSGDSGTNVRPPHMLELMQQPNTLNRCAITSTT